MTAIDIHELGQPLDFDPALPEAQEFAERSHLKSVPPPAEVGEANESPRVVEQAQATSTGVVREIGAVATRPGMDVPHSHLPYIPQPPVKSTPHTFRSPSEDYFNQVQERMMAAFRKDLGR
jgi:hypothetical protein